MHARRRAARLVHAPDRIWQAATPCCRAAAVLPAPAADKPGERQWPSKQKGGLEAAVSMSYTAPRAPGRPPRHARRRAARLVHAPDRIWQAATPCCRAAAVLPAPAADKPGERQWRSKKKGALEAPFFVSRTARGAMPKTGGADGTRTRDLRRDRPAF